METKRMGKQTVHLTLQPGVAAAACVGGKKESEGPLRKFFDYLSPDSRFGAKSWEKAESAMLTWNTSSPGTSSISARAQPTP